MDAGHSSLARRAEQTMHGSYETEIGNKYRSVLSFNVCTVVQLGGVQCVLLTASCSSMHFNSSAAWLASAGPMGQLCSAAMKQHKVVVSSCDRE